MASLFQTLRARALAPAALLLMAGAGQAIAQDRCEGTLCDLYYGHMAAPAQPAAPAPTRQAAPAAAQLPVDGVLTRLFSGSTPPPQQPAGAPPAKKPLVAVQGGGVVGLMQGRAPQRCTGTLCDLYYGGPPKDEPTVAEPAAAAPEPAARAADAEIDEPVVTSRGLEPRESVRSCAVNPRDPWACYRR